MKKIVFGIVMALCCFAATAQVNEQNLAALARGRQGDVGIAVIFRDKIYTVSNSGKYPLMNTFNIHVAMAALNRMENEKIPLDRKVTVKPGQLRKDVYSPMRKEHPSGKIQTTYRELLDYAVTYGDGNATDWLISFAGGIREIDSYIKQLGIANFNLSKTQYELGKDLNACYSNWGTPASVVQLLRKLNEGKILFEEHVDFLTELMEGSEPGKDKMRAGLPAEVGLAHISGRSDRLPKGAKPGDCDAGIITLPNGEKCYIAVLTKDSKESDASDAKLMADIAAMVFRQTFILR